MKPLLRRRFRHPPRRPGSGSDGSVLIYVIAVMTLFALLGAAMVAMFSSATMMSTGTPNYTRQARYLAESGMRHAVSELRNTGYSSNVIAGLNSTTFTLAGSGSFELNVFGKWFQAASDYSQTNGTISLDIPEGEVIEGFSIPANAYLVNLESYRDSIYFGGGSADSAFSAQIQNPPDMTASPLAVDLGDDFQAEAAQGHRILLAAKPDPAAYSYPASISAGSTLDIAGSAEGFFPKNNGSFYVVDTAGRIDRIYYDTLDDQSDLTGISSSFTLNSSDDYLILSERNHALSAAATVGGAGSGGSLELAMDFQPNISSPQPIPPPPPKALPPDVSPDDFISGTAPPAESNPGAVTVDTGTGTVNLGGNVSSASGAVFFGGTVTLGGLDVCTGGKCRFFDGVRAFFVFDYTGAGDGFTFTLASGSENNLDAYGATGGQMGYAGTSPTGKQIDKPKLAVEFDTYTNGGHNDPGSSNKDYIQHVFWGTDAASNADDNTHDETSGGHQQKWEFTNPSGGIVAKPAVDPNDGTVYIGSRDGRLYAINPDGFEKWRFDTGDQIFSSPAVAADGTVYVGSDLGGGAVFALDPAAGSEDWRFTTPASNIRSGPVIGPDGAVHFGSWVNDNFFWAVNSAGAEKWRSATSTATSPNYPQVDSTPAMDIANDALYFSSRFNGTGYLHYRVLSTGAVGGSAVNLQGDTFSSPVVAPDGTIYVGSDAGSYQGIVFALNPDGTQKWAFDPAVNDWNFRTTPAIGPDGTIYAGTDEGRLWAVNPDGSEKWRFPDASSTAIDDIRGAVLVHGDGTIWFGCRDQHLYVVDSDGLQLARLNLGADIVLSNPDGLGYQYANSPAQGPDGTVYMAAADGDVFAFSPACPPQNIRNRNYTSDDLPGGITVADANDWLDSGPWAVRAEIIRSRTLNARNKYEYTLKMWIRQCQETDCSDILGSYFEDTRIEYAAKDPHITQTVELCTTDHNLFDTFIFGFTEGTGSAVQSIDITETQLGFIRPGDFVITSDDDWP